MTFFVTAQAAFHHCAFRVITAHFVHHCTLKQALPPPYSLGYWINFTLFLRILLTFVPTAADYAKISVILKSLFWTVPL